MLSESGSILPVPVCVCVGLPGLVSLYVSSNWTRGNNPSGPAEDAPQREESGCLTNAKHYRDNYWKAPSIFPPLIRGVDGGNTVKHGFCFEDKKLEFSEARK